MQARHGLQAEYSKPVCVAGAGTQSTHEAEGSKPSPRKKVKKSSSTAKQVSAGKVKKSKHRRDARLA